jgi:hypothetical protein
MFPMSFRNRDAYHVPNCECACDNRAGALFIQDEKKRRGARAERENDREIWDTVDAGGGWMGGKRENKPHAVRASRSEFSGDILSPRS